MGSFEEQRQQVTARAKRAGYGMRRNNFPPYGWALTRPGGKVVASGSLDALETFLTEESADAGVDSGEDRLRR
ncbi:hypothetical protein [Nocardia colli]|uniref:hypothetical protein n=1 Tax=Nocardia colli TaxID=2545717 RepID=UPI0035D951FA